jgi:predicted ATP-grasp superfamily ATP-dependent carboligase
MNPPGISEIRVTKPVLVPTASALGVIAVIRSLGRAGYPVHACANSPYALGLHSRYAHRAVVHPNEYDPAFLPWLRNYVSSEGVRAVVPSETFYLAIRDEYDAWRPFLPDSVSADIAYRCLSKCSVAEFFASSPDERLRERLPRSVVVSRSDSTPRGELGTLAYPVVLKTDACRDTRARKRGSVTVVRDEAALLRLVDQTLESHECCLIQEMVPGCKATATLVIHGNQVLVDNMKYAAHENPHTGGITALRTIWWHPEMMADALRRVAALQWQGPAMVEYKWDVKTGRFWFIELNSRYWATLNVDLLAGRDYPRHQLDAHFGHVQTILGPIPEALRFWCRDTFPADAGYLMSLLRDPGVPAGRKLAALAEAIQLSLDPRVKSDLWFEGDRGLYWRAMWDFLRRLGRS